MASNASDTLAKFLEHKLTDRLKALEQKGRQKVRDELAAQLNPASDEASKAAKEANDRVNELRAELEKRPAFPWAHPLLSAAAFEVVQSSVVQCWLMAGEPKTQNELVPAVREYIRFQTGVFSSAIGADRVLPNVATPATGARTTTKKKSSKKRTKKTGKKRRKKTSP